MTIEIHKLELELLIAQRMEAGAFDSVEDVLLQALTSAPLPAANQRLIADPTSADFLAAMRSSPLQEVELEHPRPSLPVRDIDL